MPGITSEANAAGVRTISSHHPWRESKQICSSESKHERGGSHRMMNEAKSTIHCRMGTDEEQSDPWICEWDLKLCFVAIHLAAREGLTHIEGRRFLWWGWCAVSQHVLGHNAICSTPALCDATRCYPALQRRTAVRTDFRSILIRLWPGIQFILQYCRWVWIEIDLKRGILFPWEINYFSVSITHKKTHHIWCFLPFYSVWHNYRQP